MATCCQRGRLDGAVVRMNDTSSNLLNSNYRNWPHDKGQPLHVWVCAVLLPDTCSAVRLCLLGKQRRSGRSLLCMSVCCCEGRNREYALYAPLIHLHSHQRWKCVQRSVCTFKERVHQHRGRKGLKKQRTCLRKENQKHISVTLISNHKPTPFSLSSRCVNFAHFVITAQPNNVQTKPLLIFSSLLYPLLFIISNKVPLNNYVRIKQTCFAVSPGTFNPHH